MEKVFLTVSFFGLFTHNGSPFNTDLRSPSKTVANTSSTANQDSYARLLTTESSTKKLAPEVTSNVKRALKTRTLTVETVSLSNPKMTSQNVIVATNTPRTANSGETAQEKVVQKDQKHSTSSAKLPSAHIPTKTLSLNFANELGKNLQNENKNFPLQGDLGVVSELTSRDPYGDENFQEEPTRSEKENEYTRVNGGSVSPTRINHIMAPSYLTKMEPSVQSPYSADKLPERSYYRNYTITPSNFSYQSNTNTSYNETANKANYANTETNPKQHRAGHARTNSYGSYGDSHSTSKLPPKYEVGGTPTTTLKSYVSTPALNANQVLNNSQSVKSFNASPYQKSIYNSKQYGSPQTADRSNYYAVSSF